MQRGGVGAWDRLRENAGGDDYGLEEMERVLCEGSGGRRSGNRSNSNRKEWQVGVREMEKTWVPRYKLRNDFPFMAKYIPNISEEELTVRKELVQKRQKQQPPSPMVTRMQWGNGQEATSILTALNYFCSFDNTTTIHEVGMCGAAFDDDTGEESLNGLKIGATPDALICHGNGTVEVLEVKNHCPFVWNKLSPHRSGSSGPKVKKRKGQKHRGRKQHCNTMDEERNEEHALPKHFLIRDFELEAKVPAVYIPQLMMEMLCVGDSIDLDKPTNTKSKQSTPICTSAVMVRQTATKGAILLRLNRDEDWISEMKYWLGQFKKAFVNTNEIPTDNFFWDDDENSRYRKFLQRTKELSESVEQVATVDHGRIQRMVKERGGGDIPLFLDCIGESSE